MVKIVPRPVPKRGGKLCGKGNEFCRFIHGRHSIFLGACGTMAACRDAICGQRSVLQTTRLVLKLQTSIMGISTYTPGVTRQQRPELLVAHRTAFFVLEDARCTCTETKTE